MSAPIPTATQIADYYFRYFENHAPCGDPQAENQCAVRMSCALEGSSPGFLNGFSPQNRVHRHRATCSDLPAHVLGAHELGHYLAQICGAQDANSSSVSISKMPRRYFIGRHGIIWFQQCYKTKQGTWSDHIDFWTGWHYMNETLEIGAGGSAGAEADLFDRSRGPVLLFELNA